MWKEINSGNYIIRYFQGLEKFGKEKLLAIAKTVEDLPRWDREMENATGITGSYMGTEYIAFTITRLDGKLNICIDSFKNFQSVLPHLKYEILLEDGTHKHGN